MKALEIVLGSGGARGLCHVGALDVLVSERVPVARVVGCSMGAIVGAAFCSGVSLEAVARWADGLSPWSFFRPTLWGPTISRTAALRHVVERLIPPRRFDELEIPLVVNCTDIDTGRAHPVAEGDVREAVIASALIAGVHTPLTLGERRLADGGYTDAVPVGLTTGLHPVLAVDPTTPPDWDWSLPRGLRSWNLLGIRGTLQLFLKATDTLFFSLVEAQRDRKPHLRLTPSMPGIRFFDFKRAEEAVRAGADAVRGQLDQIQTLVEED